MYVKNKLCEIICFLMGYHFNTLKTKINIKEFIEQTNF